MPLPILIALLAAQPAAAAATPVPEPALERIVTAIGYFAGVDQVGDEIRLKLDDTPLRFRLPRLSEAETERWAQLVSTASQRGFALHARFDATAGRVDAQSATIVYPLCALSIGNLQPLGDESANCPVAAAADQRGSLAALARGIAAWARPRAALQLLGEALADRSLAPNLRTIALRAHAEADLALAADTEWGGEAFDRLIAAALADSRERVGIAPDDVEALFAAGTYLDLLGGYDEALAIYAAIGRRWPDEALRVATREGGIHRQRGDYRRALAALDDYAARAGRPDAMRFSYHRAWTLMMLARFQEALTEIDLGLRTQPDYVSAWQLRSCAHVQLGAAAEALSDQQRALELFEALARDGEPDLGADIERSRRLVALLRETSGRAGAETLDLACRAPWQKYVRARPRSPLLGPPPR